MARCRKPSAPGYHLTLATRQLSQALVKLRSAEGPTDRYYELVRHSASVMSFKKRLKKGE